MSVKIYHNPHCSKSRQTLALLERHHINPEIELYLQKRYGVAELQALADKLQVGSVREMMRTKDELYRTLKLDDTTLSEQQLLQAIADHSALLERPIVVNGEKAKIGRPPESVLAIL
ncbi:MULTISPECIES: arsenate reductase (glutaredoxin) [Pasteurellaceae]|uniref:arsenate reductase (glutaredoxin) n=1 Tax=Pasteurellaceae TaxID=712 RepID=UPI00356862F6